MKPILPRLWGGAAVAAVFLWLTVPAALAADGGSSWRGTYDIIMLWVNFAILVFILVKYLKEPVRDFFANRKDEIEIELKRIEDGKKAALDKVAETERQLLDSQVRLEKMKVRISREGENAKRQIIEDAQAQSVSILDDAKQRITYSLIEAKNRFKSELVDAAVDMALEKLPDQVTETDNQKYIDLYLKTAV